MHGAAHISINQCWKRNAKRAAPRYHLQGPNQQRIDTKRLRHRIQNDLARTKTLEDGIQIALKQIRNNCLGNKLPTMSRVSEVALPKCPRLRSWMNLPHRIQQNISTLIPLAYNTSRRFFAPLSQGSVQGLMGCQKNEKPSLLCGGIERVHNMYFRSREPYVCVTTHQHNFAQQQTQNMHNSNHFNTHVTLCVNNRNGNDT